MDCRGFELLVRGYLESFCVASRIEHSLSVAALAAKLCRRFGVDAEKGQAAGLAHDLMKDKPREVQWEHALRAKKEPALDFFACVVSEMEMDRGRGKSFADKIIHGPAAAVFLYNECGLRDRDMLEAVALHSSAAETMSPLAKIVFIADKMEPRRSYLTPADAEATESLGIDALLLRALGLSLGWLQEKNYAIAQSTTDLYNALTMRKAAQ